MTERNPVLGIDISKRKFDVCLITVYGGKEKYRTFTNDIEGFERLSKFLHQNGIRKVHACMEPTGRFGNKLAIWLHGREQLVSIINPYRIKGFAISELKRSKTDKIDAGIIARFCQMHQPELWAPQTKELEELRQIGRYMDTLKDLMTEEKNRLSAEVESEQVRNALKSHIAHLREQIVQLKARMCEIIRSDERLKNAFDVLRTIIGVSDLTALAFLGELGLGEQFRSARQVEAYCGLNPCLRQSGHSINCKPRLSKMGNCRMRRALYMPALAALRCNPAIQGYGARLKAAGKHGKVVVGAVMRKLLRVMFAVVRSNCAYDYQLHMQC